MGTVLRRPDIYQPANQTPEIMDTRPKTALGAVPTVPGMIQASIAGVALLAEMAAEGALALAMDGISSPAPGKVRRRHLELVSDHGRKVRRPCPEVRCEHCGAFLDVSRINPSTGRPARKCLDCNTWHRDFGVRAAV
jgi:hypothetical protein